MQRIAIIGAGLSGAVLTDRLVKAGREVTLFEKSRGTGGRLASARLGDFSADLGASCIDAYSESFTAWLAHQKQLGRVHSWAPRTISFKGKQLESPPVWVGVGRNSSLTRELIQGATLRTETRIGVVWPDKEGVLLRDEYSNSLGHFDAVICTAPAPQAVSLLEAVPRFANHAEEAVTDPSWVYVAVLEQLPSKLSGVDLVMDGLLGIERVFVESNKPNRGGVVIKVEMSRDWSEDNINLHADTVKAEAIQRLEAWLDERLIVKVDRIHRWLYSSSLQPSPNELSLWDKECAIGACGDWIGPAGLEGSFLSASDLADRLLDSGQSAA